MYRYSTLSPVFPLKWQDVTELLKINSRIKNAICHTH